MGVYTPIPEELLPRVPRGVRNVGRVVLVVALIVLAAAIVRATFFASPRPAFQNFGVVHTSIGAGAVVCGGEVSPGCGSTTIRFASCSQQYHYYFGAVSNAASVDRLVRTLTGKRPPAGDSWAVQCGGADGMMQGQPLATLQSD